MSDTPETDRAEIDMSFDGVTVHTKYVRADFAKRLERQRNKMRDALEWAQSEIGKTTRPNPVDKALAAAKGETL